MRSHEPEGYACPFCSLVEGRATRFLSPDDVVYDDDTTLAFVSPRWWPQNEGHVVVIPKAHFENVYTISDDLIADVYRTARTMAIALARVYPSDGTSMRQHNEPAGGQDVWHFHVHVFPRYVGDHLYERHASAGMVDAGARSHHVRRLRAHFGQGPPA
jgi:histidine triad (HIT) family protein